MADEKKYPSKHFGEDMDEAISEVLENKVVKRSEGNGMPSNLTPGVRGQRYYDLYADKEYVCAGKQNGLYIWKRPPELAYEDYTDDKVSKLAPVITDTTETAESLEITGTAEAPLELTLHGASSQGANPSPDNPQPIVTADSFTVTVSQADVPDDNLFDMDRWYSEMRAYTGSDTNPVRDSDGLFDYITVNATGVTNVQYMLGEFEDKVRYTIAYKGKRTALTGDVGLAVYYTDGTSQAAYTGTNNLDWQHVVYITATNKTINYIRVAAGVCNYAEIQIIKGVYTAINVPAYIKHITPRKQQVTIDIHLRGIPAYAGGWSIRDEIKIINGRVMHIQRCTVHVFDGTESVTWYASYGRKGFQFTPSPLMLGGPTAKAVGACSHLVNYQRDLSATDIPHPWFGVDDGAASAILYAVNIDAWVGPTTGTVKTWLAEQYAAGTPFTIQYALRRPIITDITDTPTGQALLNLHSYNGTTTITTDAIPAVDVSATYHADTKSYINKKFDELAEMIHNLT